MRRSIVLGTLAAVTLVFTACRDATAPSDPQPSTGIGIQSQESEEETAVCWPTNVGGQITALFGNGSRQRRARDLFRQLKQHIANDDQARAERFAQELEFFIKRHQSSLLDPCGEDPPNKDQARSVLIGNIYAVARGGKVAEIPPEAYEPDGGVGMVDPTTGGTVPTTNGEAAVVVDPGTFSGTTPVTVAISRTPDSTVATSIPGLTAFPAGYDITATQQPDPAGPGALIALCILPGLPPAVENRLVIGHDLGGGNSELLIPTVDVTGVIDCNAAGPSAMIAPTSPLGLLAQVLVEPVRRHLVVKPLYASALAGKGLGGRTKSLSFFAPVDPQALVFHTLTVTGSGSGSGVILGGGNINCSWDGSAASGACSQQFQQGVVVGLTATADPGSQFNGWSGGGCSGTGGCNVTMDQAHTVTADFSPQQSATCGSGPPLNSDLTLNSAQDLANFRATGTSVINGDVDVSAPGITDVSGLQCVTTISGNLNIHFSDQLQSIDLPALQSVENMQINDNIVLSTIDMVGLQTVGDGLAIIVNDLLQSINLPALQSVDQLLTIDSHPVLTSIDLSSLQTITGPQFQGWLSISANGNQVTTTMTLALPLLTSVAGFVSVDGNGNISSANMPALASVGGAVMIGNNSSLASVSLPSLTTIASGQELRVEGNSHLSSLDLSGLQSAQGQLFIGSNGAQATSLSPLSFPALSTIASDLFILDDNSFNSVAFPSLTTLGGIFQVSRSGTLTDLQAPSLTSASFTLHIGDNPALTDVSFSGLATVYALTVTDNAVLSSLDLSSVQSVADALVITTNGLQATSSSALTLPSLTTVGDALLVSRNGSFTSLDAPTLTSVGGLVSLGDNTSMTSIALPNLSTISGQSLDVTRNPDLSSLDISSVQSVPNLLSIALNGTQAASRSALNLPSLTSVGGQMIVFSNGGFNSLSAPNLSSVGQELRVEDNSHLAALDLSSLQNVQGVFFVERNGAQATSPSPLLLPMLTSVGAHFHINNNGTFVSLDAPVLASVGGRVFVINNTSVISISLPSLTTINGPDLAVQNNDQLSSLDLGSVQSVNGLLLIARNGSQAPSASPLALSSLNSVGGLLLISDNGGFSSLGAPNLSTVGGSVNVSLNTLLASVSMPNLTTINGTELRVEDNTHLSSLDVSSVQSVNALVWIVGNGAQATSASPLLLSSLGSVNGNLSVLGNDGFSSLDLASLTNVGQSVVLNTNSTLVSISAPNLQTVGGPDLRIETNAVLSTLNLNSLQSVGNLFYVIQNPNLCTSVVQAIANQVSVPIVTISGNANC